MFKRFLNLGAMYYTTITALLIVFSLMFGDNNKILDPLRFLLILVFSFIMALGTVLKESEGLGKATKIITHAICYVGGFFFCIILPVDPGFSVSVILLALFSIIYTVVCVTKSVLINKRTEKHGKTKNKTSKKDARSNSAKEKSSATEYKSLFSDNRSE